MTDYNVVVDNIRAFLSSVDQTRTEGLADLASEYAALCREANARLRRCGDYLRRGMRTEAVHLAEAQPSLLDLVAALDFPELQEFQNTCSIYELSPPPKLLMEVAQELNEAYALE